MTTRVASHAGSWYTKNGKKLESELEAYLASVNLEGTPPIPGARVIIAP